MILDAGRLDHLFGIFERAAVAGRRCPTADELPSCSQALARELARQGRIRIEISGRNWRQIFILTGPMAGKSTAPNPDGHRIWRIIGRDDRVNGCIFRRRGRAEHDDGLAIAARKHGVA